MESQFTIEDPNVGLSIKEDRTFIKCYLGDTGLLLSHAFDWMKTNY